MSETFSCCFMKLSPGEAHDRLRRVDSNRRSRSFSKQPSTGDYYKALSTESAEPRGSRAMAPNEEVGNPHPPPPLLGFTAVQSHGCSHLLKLLHRSDLFSCWLVSCSHPWLFCCSVALLLLLLFLNYLYFLCPARMSRKTWLLPATYLHCQQEKTSVLWLSPETCLYNLKGLRSGRECGGEASTDTGYKLY